MAHVRTPAVADQTEPHLVQGACARSGDNVLSDGLAAALTSIAETETTEMRALIGNMCCPPQAGLVIASFLAIHPEFKILAEE